jgi:hypothetical protein
MEGTERIRRFVNGVDFYSVDNPTLDWSERVVSLITGILLLLPFVNIIVWLAMETFGNPDIFADEYTPTLAAPTPTIPIEAPETIPVAPVADASQPSKHFEFLDTFKNGPSILSSWTHQTYQNQQGQIRHRFNKVDPGETSEAILDENLGMIRYELQFKNVSSPVIFERTSHHIKIRADYKNVNKTLSVKPEIPQIQQLTVQLRTFAKSNQNSLVYYSVNFNDWDVHEMIAKKEGIIQHPKLGRVVQVSVKPNSYFSNLAAQAYVSACSSSMPILLFNPITGDLLQMEYPDPIDPFNPFKGCRHGISVKN